MCRKGGAPILAEAEAGSGKSQTFGGTHPQERKAKERTGVLRGIMGILQLSSFVSFRNIQKI